MKTEVFDVLGPDGFGAYEVEWEPGPKFHRVSRPPRGLLIPGFVDIHFHGAFGVDSMTATPDDMKYLCGRLSKVGYEWFLPTTVTASLDAVKSAVDHLIEHEMIAGFHLEGPFISPVFPGAQPKEYIVDPPMGPGEWDCIFGHDRLKVITMAPERPGALELISALMEAGVVVSMGHTNATYEEARRGFEFGASHTTHTFNAMRPFHHREAGIVAYALNEDSLYCELIYDRLHVCKDAAELLLKCKSNDRVIAISDSTMATGMPAGTSMEMWGTPVVVGRHDVRLLDGTLAGSSITVADAFRNLHDDFGPETAIKLCCVNGRRALGIHPEPHLWLELDEELEIVEIHRVQP